MDQAIRAAQVDERAEVAQTGHGSAHDIAFVQRSQQAGFLLGTPFALRFALGEDQAAAILVDLDHLHADSFADQFVEHLAAFVALESRAHRDHMRGRDEAFKRLPPHQHAAPVVAGDGHLDHIILVE